MFADFAPPADDATEENIFSDFASKESAPSGNMFADFAPPQAGLPLQGSLSGTVVGEGAKGIVRGAGNVLSTAIKGAPGFYAAAREGVHMSNVAALDILDRIERGEQFPAGPTPTIPRMTAPERGDVPGSRLEQRIETMTPEGAMAPDERWGRFLAMTPEQRAAERARLAGEVSAYKPTNVEDTLVYKAGQGLGNLVSETFPVAKGWVDSVTNMLSEGLGSVAGGIGLYGVGGPFAAGTLFTLSGAGEAADRAIEWDKTEKAAGRPGASPQDIATASIFGTVAGSTDLVPIEAALGVLRVPAPFRKPIAQSIARVGGQALIEGGQEGVQQIIQNAIAQGVYNPDQDITEGVAPNVAAGAGVGGIVQTVVEALTPGRKRGGAPQPVTEPAAPPAPPAEAVAPPAATLPQPTPVPAPVAAPELAGDAIPEEAEPETQRSIDELPADEVETLRSAGWTDDAILDMADEERVAAAEEAREQGVTGAPARPPVAGAPAAASPMTEAPVEPSPQAEVRPAEVAAPGTGSGVVEPAPRPAQRTPAAPAVKRQDRGAEAVRAAPQERDRSDREAVTAEPRSFTTAKGSTYVVHEDGTTSRNKKYRPEHGEKEQGPQPRSQATFYVTGAEAEELGLFQTQGGAKMVIAPIGDGRWGVKYLDGKDAGKFERRTVVMPRLAPEVGLTPVEVWNDGARVHFGNAITEVGGSASRAVDTARSIEMFDPRTLKVNPTRFQFRENTDAEGVAPTLRNVQKWRPERGNQIIVWEDKSGDRYVVDGHQRTGLARRLLAEGKEQDIQIPGVIFRESEGVTAEEATTLASLKNTAEGSASPIEAAKVLRSASPERLADLPMPKDAVRSAVDLSRLAEEPFRMVINGVVEPNHAKYVGRFLADDPDRQVAAMKALARAEPANEDEAAVLVRRVAAAELAKDEAGAQVDMFGTTPDSTALEEVRIVAAAMRQLRRDKTLFAKVAAEADRIESTGSKIEREAAVRTAEDADRLSSGLDTIAFRAGPIRDKLKALAAEVKNESRPLSEARGIFVDALRSGDEVAGAARRGAGKPEREDQGGGEQRQTEGARGRSERLASAKVGPPTTETVQTVDGPREQTVLPGAERISDEELARRRQAEAVARKQAERRVAPKKPQKAADEGLFGEGDRQLKLFRRNAGKGISLFTPSDRRALENNLRSIIGRVAGRRVQVEFRDVIQREGMLSEQASAAVDEAAAAGGTSVLPTIGGYWQGMVSGDALIAVALNDPSFDPTTTAFHEAWHQIEMMVLNEQELRVLRAEMPRLRAFAAREMDRSPNDPVVRAWPDYEITAIAFQRYARMKKAREDIGGIGIAVRRMFDKIMEVLRQVRRTLRGQGVTRYEDLFGRAYRGDFAARQEGQRAVELALADEWMDGEPKVLASAMPAPRQTETEAFKRWFGKSKVVNADGSPRVMYHGTRESFEAFDATKASRDALFGPGFYFTSSPDVAGGMESPITPQGQQPRDFDDMAWRAAFNQAGYAWQGTRYEVDAAALTPRKMGHLWRLMNSKQHLSDIREMDATGSMRRERDRVMNAIEAKDTATVTQWLANDAPRWMRDRMGIEKSPVTRPQVYPVYLSIERPFDLTVGANEDRYFALVKEQGSKEAANSYLAKQGYDGIRHAGGAVIRTMGEHDVWIAFRPAQIKSVANRGTFDPNDPRILASSIPMPGTAPGSILADRTERFKARVRDVTDPIRLRAQDRYLAIKRFQEGIEKQIGRPLDTPINVYQAIRLYTGRGGEKLVDLQSEHIEPLIEDMRARKVSGADLDDYLYARHAPERNREMAKINPDVGDAGSGMSDAEAQAIMDRFAAEGRTADLEAMAARVDAINTFTRRELVTAGLIDPRTALAWKMKYPNYVPLRGFDDPAASVDQEGIGLPKTGKGFDVRGPESKQALGRRSKADSPLAYVVQQAERAIVRAEKNRTLKTVLRFAQDPAVEPSGIIKVNKAEMKRRVDPVTGLVETYAVPPQFSKAENLFAVKIGGKTHWMTIEHPGFARALRGVGSGVDNALARGLLSISHTYAKLLTQWNPEFVPTNAVRDLQTALVNVSEFDSLAKGTRRKILKDAFTLKSVRGAMAAMYGKATSNDMAPYYDEFRRAGGKVSYIELNEIDAIKKRIARSVKAGDMRRALGNAADLVGNLNTAVENGVRLSVYANLRKAGVEKDRAAFIARDLTTDFNLRGEWGPTINALYIFFNASIQGTFRMARAVARSRTAQIAVASIFAAGFGMEFLNALLSGGDDDDNPYDKIPEYEFERNMIIMLPGGDYVKLPLAYGYNVPYIAGQQLARLFRGKTETGAAAAMVGTAAIDSFNPLGTVGSINQLVAPWFVEPFVQSGENTNFAGSPIMPTQYDEKKPLSESYWKTVPSWAKWVSRQLNEATGGNVGRPGAIDISPETIQHYVEFAGGGVGRFLANAFATGEKVVTGEELLPEKMPFVRRFYGKTDTGAAIERQFFDAWAEIDQAHYEQLRLKEAGDTAAMTEARETYRPEIAAYGAFNGAMKTRKKLREARDAAERIEDADARKARLDQIEEREKAVMENALSIYRRAKGD